MKLLNRCWLCLLALAFLAGCNFNTPQNNVTPTVESLPPTAETLDQDTPQPTPTPSPSPSPTLDIATPLPTETPSETPSATPTLGPYEHTIKQGETLLAIIQFYGYRDAGVIPEIIRINPNVPNADTLPGEGNVILIPRQTAIPPPTSDSSGQGVPVVTLPPNRPDIACYTIEAGDTAVGIAEDYATTLEILSQLNPTLNWFRCDFSNYSGGPNCNPNLQVGQCINVPAPTLTPTLSPTPSGSETPTPTPTRTAPTLLYPPEGAVAAPAIFRLQWVGVGVLGENEYYLVQVNDLTNGAQFNQVTKQTSLLLPERLIPTDGQTHTINWLVAIASPNEQGVFRIIGGTSPIRSFQWQSR